jgi:hypothetical protein
MVGGAHTVLDRTPQPLGQLVADVADLVLLASGDDRVVEDVQDRAAQRLGTVDDPQDRPGSIQPEQYRRVDSPPSIRSSAGIRSSASRPSSSADENSG